MPVPARLVMLFTDVEGSTQMARTLGDEWPSVLAAHGRILTSAIVDAGGRVERTEGDAFFATFAEVYEAVAAAAAGQRGLRAYPWPAEVGELLVRMGIHVGLIERDGEELVGIEIHRAARIGAAARGGQVLLSMEARAALDREVEVEDLGMHRLKDFPEPGRLYHLAVHADRGAATFPTPRTLQARPTNLPPERRPLIGRERLLGEVGQELRDHRLVTLTGLGGVGKTHLALSAASALLEEQSGGVWLVRGDQLRSGSELIPTLAAAMRIRDTPEARVVEAIADHLQADPAIVVLDNLEHLSEAAHETWELLTSAPSIRVLATSRTPLRLALERRIAVEPLPRETAATLFIRLAREVEPNVALDDQTAIQSVCDAVDGLPLGLELAAARLRILSLSELALRLGSTADLNSTAPDLPDRQRSLRSTVAWSLALLSPGAKQLFARLGVFAGPVTLEAIEGVCGHGVDVVEPAAELIDYALLRRGEQGLGLAPALREIAREELAASGEEHDIRRVHARFLLDEAVNAGPHAAASVDDNHRVDALLGEAWHAAAWARTADPSLHLQLATLYAPRWGWVEGRVSEAMRESSEALVKGGSFAGKNDLSRLMFTHALTMIWCGQTQEALELAERAAEETTDRSPQYADDLIILSLVRSAGGAHQAAVQAAERAVALAREADHNGRLLRSLAYQAQALIVLGDLESAGPLIDEAEKLAGQIDTVMARGLPNIRGDWALESGDPRSALAGFAASLAASISLGEDGAVLWHSAGIVCALAQLGDRTAALECATLLTLASAEQGVDTGALRMRGVTIPEVIAEMTRELPDTDAERVRFEASSVPTGQRAERILALARLRVDVPNGERA